MVPSTKASDTLPPLLLVDDDTDFLDAFSAAIRSWGYPVVAARDGREALELIDNREHDWLALITDFNMPNLNGGELIRAVNLRGVPFFVVVLFSSLNISDNEVVTLRGDLGQDVPFHFMSKPIATDSLKALLAKAAERARNKTGLRLPT